MLRIVFYTLVLSIFVCRVEAAQNGYPDLYGEGTQSQDIDDILERVENGTWYDWQDVFTLAEMGFINLNSQKASGGMSFLQLAINNDNPKVVERLLELGETPTKDDVDTARQLSPLQRNGKKILQLLGR